jgi:hypothetical protein
VVTFEDICYWLDSMYGIATPTGTGPYTYVYNPGSTKPTPRMFTLCKGGPEGVYSVTGGIADTLEMVFEANTFATFSCGLIGDDYVSDTLDTLTDRAFTVAHGNQAALWIDDWAAAAGTTTFDGVKFNATLSLGANRALKAGLGSQSAVGWRQAKADPAGNSLALSLELDDVTGGSKAIYDALITATTTPLRKIFRLKFTYDANRTLQIDFAGYSAEAPPAWGDVDGSASIDFVFNAQYDATLSDWMEITVTNNVAALP